MCACGLSAVYVCLRPERGHLTVSSRLASAFGISFGRSPKGWIFVRPTYRTSMPPECDRHDHSMSLGSGDRYDLVVPILMEKAVWLEDVGACAGRGRESHPSKPTRLWNVFSSSGSARRKRAAHLRACYAPTSGRKSVVVTCFSSTSLAKGGFRIQDRERGARGQRYCSVPLWLLVASARITLERFRDERWPTKSI